MRHWYYWLVGFGLTLLFEAPIVLRLLARSEPRWVRRVTLFLFANLVTHPLVWFFFPMLPLSRTVTLTISETWAFCGETVFYRMMGQRVSLRRAAVTSLLANAFSFSVGYFLVKYFQSYLFPR